MFVEARCNGAIVLDFVEEALDVVAAFVGARAERGGIEAMVERPDVGLGALSSNFGAERVAVVGAIGEQHAFARQCFEHVFRALAVMGLAFRQLQRDRKAAGIDEGVDFGRKPAAGTAHATATAAFFSPFAAC